MGGTMPERLVRKRSLEIALSQLKPHPSPKAYLEQYTIPPEVAAEMLYIAAYVHDDIIDKTVIDLGCGTGRLAIGAVLLGANMAVGIDIDEVATRVALRNAEAAGVTDKTFWVAGDINAVRGRFDTVLQNPPFGVQRRSADRAFLLKALEIGDVIYSLHKSGRRNREFIKRFIEQQGGKISGIFPLELSIFPIFKFHTKRKHVVRVDLYRMEGSRDVLH